jgi:membrane protease YdiL (CAAX protease family)
MSGFPWPEFLVIFGLALVGAVAVLPYAFSLNQSNLAKAKLSGSVLALISFLQTAILVGIATAVGLLAARASGLGAPFIEALISGQPAPGSFLNLLPITFSLALLSFVAIALLERYVFGAHVPEALRTSDTNTKAWKRFLASFYGAIDEEVLIRLFIVSGLAWILARFWQNASGLPADGAYWIAILLAAVIFGVSHLPTTRALVAITPMLIARAIVINGLAGIAFGWLYWRYGLEAAMLSHFCTDLLLHLVGPLSASRVYKNAQQSTEAS